MKNNLFKQLSSKKNALLYKIFCASILGSSMLLVQDQLATAGPKPNKQKKYYEIEAENDRSISNPTTYKTQSGTYKPLPQKDFVTVGFDGKGPGGGGPGDGWPDGGGSGNGGGDHGPGGSGPGNGGPRSKDYGNSTTSSKGPDNMSTAQGNPIPNIISLDSHDRLVSQKAPQFIQEEVSIKPKPPRLRLEPNNAKLPDEGNSFFPDIVSYAIREDGTARKVSTQVIEPHTVSKEAKSIPSELQNTSPKGSSHVTRHSQSHSELPNIAADNSNQPKPQEPLKQSKSTKYTVQDDKIDTANSSTLEPLSSGCVTPQCGFSMANVVLHDALTRGTSARDGKIGYNQGSPTPKEMQEGLFNSPKLAGMYNNDDFSKIDLEGSETSATTESKNTETSERFSEDAKTSKVDQTEESQTQEIKIKTSDQIWSEYPVSKRSKTNQEDAAEVVRENTPSINEESEAKYLAQDEKILPDNSQPVSNKISNQTKVQNYANRITLVRFQLQALQAIEHHIGTWSATTLSSLTPSAALPAAGDYDDEESFSPLTQIMKKGTLVPWISGHYGKSIQGKVKDSPAYRADLGGFSIGSDFVLNECTVLGVSYTKITSKVKYRQDRLGDNATTDSQTFAIYGQYNIRDTLFAQSAISYTKGLTKHNYINQENYKSSSRGFAGFVTLNNVFALSKNTFIVPRVGLRYIENKEKEVQVGNAKITGVRNHYLTAILGSKILFRKDLGDVSITPGLYAGLEQPIVTKNKGAKASIIEAGQTLEYQAPASKSKNMTYNLGAEISAKRKNLVLSLSYQCLLAKKYANHQGTLKIGIAF